MGFFITAYEYVPDTEEASDSVMSSVDTASPRPLTESDSEMSNLPKEILEEMRKMQQNMEIDIDEVKNSIQHMSITIKVKTSL